MLAKKTEKRHVQISQTFSRMESDTKHKVMKDLYKGCLTGTRTGPKVIKVFSCSTQLRMKFYMLISIKVYINSAFSRLR